MAYIWHGIYKRAQGGSGRGFRGSGGEEQDEVRAVVCKLQVHVRSGGSRERKRHFYGRIRRAALGAGGSHGAACTMRMQRDTAAAREVDGQVGWESGVLLPAPRTLEMELL